MGIIAPNEESTYRRMHEVLKNLIPDFEIQEKAKLAYRINRLKKEKNAVILGHNYMEAALYHSVPDFTGDSLALCQQAATTDADIIVFCGVRFMAESAKILNPEKTVLLPAVKAGCSLAAAITADDVRALKKRFPGVPVVTYINSYADVKAETEVCCTSANAVKVIESLKTDTVIFLPDEFMAGNIAAELGWSTYFPQDDPEGTKQPANLKNTIISWHGSCEVHELFTPEDVTSVRKQFPDVAVLAHPECKPEVVRESDFVGSTKGIIDYVDANDAPEFLLLTECAMGDNIIAGHPDKNILRLCSHRCPHMAEITLEDTLDALENTRYEITVPEDIRLRALGSIERMLAIV